MATFFMQQYGYIAFLITHFWYLHATRGPNPHLGFECFPSIVFDLDDRTGVT